MASPYNLSEYTKLYAQAGANSDTLYARFPFLCDKATLETALTTNGAAGTNNFEFDMSDVGLYSNNTTRNPNGYTVSQLADAIISWFDTWADYHTDIIPRVIKERVAANYWTGTGVLKPTDITTTYTFADAGMWDCHIMEYTAGIPRSVNVILYPKNKVYFHYRSLGTYTFIGADPTYERQQWFAPVAVQLERVLFDDNGTIFNVEDNADWDTDANDYYRYVVVDIPANSLSAPTGDAKVADQYYDASNTNLGVNTHHITSATPGGPCYIFNGLTYFNSYYSPGGALYDFQDAIPYVPSLQPRTVYYPAGQRWSDITKAVWSVGAASGGVDQLIPSKTSEFTDFYIGWQVVYCPEPHVLGGAYPFANYVGQELKLYDDNGVALTTDASIKITSQSLNTIPVAESIEWAFLNNQMLLPDSFIYSTANRLVRSATSWLYVEADLTDGSQVVGTNVPVSASYATFETYYYDETMVYLNEGFEVNVVSPSTPLQKVFADPEGSYFTAANGILDLPILPARMTVTSEMPNIRYTTRSLKSNVVFSGAQRFRFIAEYAPMSQYDAQALISSFDKFQGRSKWFYFPIPNNVALPIDKYYRTATFSTTEDVVFTEHPTTGQTSGYKGDKTVVLFDTVFPAIPAGSLLKFANHDKIYKTVVEAVIESDSSVKIKFEPALMKDVGGSAIVLHQEIPTWDGIGDYTWARVRIDDDFMTYTTDGSGLVSITIKLIEDIE